MILCFWFFLIASLHKRTTSVFALPTIFILFLPLKFEPLWMNAFSSFKQRRSSVWLLFLWLNSATSALFSWDSLAYCFLSPFMFLSILASSARTTSTFILLTTSALFAEKCVLRLWSSSMPHLPGRPSILPGILSLRVPYWLLRWWWWSVQG